MGLPSFDSQKKFLPNRIPYTNVPEEDKNLVNAFAESLGGHRLSIKNFDRIMVEKMRDLFPNHDGYMSKTPSAYHGLFNQEICFFNRNGNVLRSIENISILSGGKKKIEKKTKRKTNKIIMAGGSMFAGDLSELKNLTAADINPYGMAGRCEPEESAEDYNIRQKKYLKIIKYERPLKYYDNGRIITPTYEEVMKSRYEDEESENKKNYEMLKKMKK